MLPQWIAGISLLPPPLSRNQLYTLREYTFPVKRTRELRYLSINLICVWLEIDGQERVTQMAARVKRQSTGEEAVAATSKLNS